MSKSLSLGWWYGQAKLAVGFCTYALARRLIGTGITVNALVPGIVATGIIEKSRKYFFKGKQKPSVPISYDEAQPERVWNISAELLGLEH